VELAAREIPVVRPTSEPARNNGRINRRQAEALEYLIEENE
jgi:hypothetical protein